MSRLGYWVTRTELLSHSDWGTQSLGLGRWVTRAGLLSHSQTGLRSHSTGLLSHSGWATESLSDWTTKSLGLGYSVTWAGLQSSSPVSLGYWVTRTVLLSHSGWATESLSDWATESLGLSYRVTGLGYWVTLRLDYGVTRLGYWVTRTVVSGGYKTLKHSCTKNRQSERTVLGRQFADFEQKTRTKKRYLGWLWVLCYRKTQISTKTKYFSRAKLLEHTKKN